MRPDFVIFYRMKTKRVIDFFFHSVKIPSPSYRENKYRIFLEKKLEKLGAENIVEKSEEGTNLIARFPSKFSNDWIGLSAHMDTVENGNEKITPVLDGNMIWSSGETILGADNKSTISMFFEAAKTIQENNIKHRPFEFLLTFGEEKHLTGARLLNPEKFISRKILLMDASGKVGGIIESSPTHYSFKIIVKGKKAHAGIEPEKGKNAIKAAALIITSFPDGRISPTTTFNVGEIRGGGATNIVPDEVVIEGEFRSTEKDQIDEIVEQLMNLNLQFEDIKTDLVQDYLGYSLKKEDSFVKEIVQVIKKTGLTPHFTASGGGSDANIFREKGLNAVNLTSGMIEPHTYNECIAVDDLIKGTEIIINILSLSEPEKTRKKTVKKNYSIAPMCGWP